MTIATTPLVAFHGSPEIKAKYVARMRAHIAADELDQGIGFDPYKHRGCAVGCTLNRYDHSAYPEEIGYPIQLARLHDAIHEGLPREEAINSESPFALAFLERAEPGADLTRVHHAFLAWMLTDGHIFPVSGDPAVHAACARVAALHTRAAGGEDVPERQWVAAGAAAMEAAEAAWAEAAAEVAARAAWAEASTAAEVAAWSEAAWSEAAWSEAAWSEAAAAAAAAAAAEVAAAEVAAAEVAARAAAAATRAGSQVAASVAVAQAAAAAKEAAWRAMAAKLLDLIAAAPARAD